MKWFHKCESVESAKALYRELSKEHHPDLGGDAEVMKEINAEMDRFLESFIGGRIYAFNEEREKNVNSTPFVEILRKVVHFNCRIEIIGFWIYCFESKEIREELKELGFWFSGKHKAWVFSGMKKKCYRSGLSIEEIRSRWGSSLVREKEEEEKRRRESVLLPA